MKVVIWCGGRGTRINELTDIIPKPMVNVGDKPVLWHIMKIYSSFGFKEFILCLGYKGEMIKGYVETSQDLEDWKITAVDTGLETLTGGRLLTVKKFLENEDAFMASYGDGLADINLNELMEFHKRKDVIVTVTGGHPYSKWGMIKTDSDNLVTGFWEKPVLTDYINIGFMVCKKEIFDFIKGDVEIEEVLKELVKHKKVAMFKHEKFFHAMDTYRDFLELNKIWESGNVPWKIWK